MLGMGFILAAFAGFLAGWRFGVMGSMVVGLLNLALLTLTRRGDYYLSLKDIIYGAGLLGVGFITGFNSDQKQVIERELAAQRKLEKNLRKSEERLRRINDQLNDLICFVDVNGYPSYINPAAIRTLGYSRDEFFGETVFSHIHPDDRERVTRRFAGIVNEVDPDRIHFRYQCRDGRTIWLEAIGTLLKDEQGRAEEVILTCREITMYMESEARMRQLAEKKQARVDALARANAMFTALANVSSKIQLATTTDAIFKALGDELQGLNINFMIMLLKPDAGEFAPQYLSLSPEAIGRLESLLGSQESFLLPTKSLPLKYISNNPPPGVYVESAMEMAQVVLTEVAENTFEQVCRDANITPRTKGAYLPLSEKNHMTGMLSVWGEALRRTDMTGLTLFANQLEAALESAKLYTDLQQLSIQDELTGIYNRRGFYDLGRREVERSLRYNRPLSLLMVDMDFFKLVNDRYRHVAGDRLLRLVARRMHSSLRELDIICRYGGDEFVVILVETDMDTARQVAERLRLMVAGTQFEVEGHTLSLSTSIGVAALSSRHHTLEALLEDADEALYQSKQKGRNQVTLHTPIDTPAPQHLVNAGGDMK